MTAVADQTPFVIVPTAVSDEFVTPVPREELERTLVPFILKVLPDTKLKLSEDDQEAHKQFNSDYLKLAGISDLLPVFNLKVQGVECDDMCSILAKRYENNEMYQVYLLTADMDWIHSVVGTNNVSIIDVYNGGTIIDHDYVVQTYNLDTRKKFTVLKSILGDKSDNIKFCNNIGPVKAKEIFNLIYTKYNDPSNDEMLEVIN